MRNKFEEATDEFQKTYRKVSRPSWEHTTETYSKGNVDWFAVAGCGFLVGLGLVLLWIL